MYGGEGGEDKTPKAGKRNRAAEEAAEVLHLLQI
jgi:hypothetical protein